VDTDALRWFQQVADGMTVTEVSELEQLTQSGVSRALARLEDQVGVPLLYRSGRTLRMTHAGAVFKRHVDAMLHSLDDGVAALGELLDPDTGTVVLAFQHSLGTWLIPDLVRGFRTDHPGVRFALHQVRDELGSPVLYGGRADLEISSRPERDPDVRHRAIALEPLRLIASRDHPLADRTVIGLAEVADQPFIGLRPRSALRKLIDELCSRAGFSPVVIFEGEDLATVRGFVAAGLGVAVVPAPRAGSAEAALSYIPIEDPGAVREISLTWSGERRLLPAAERFRVYVLTRAAAGRLPALDLEVARIGAVMGRVSSSVLDRYSRPAIPHWSFYAGMPGRRWPQRPPHLPSCPWVKVFLGQFERCGGQSHRRNRSGRRGPDAASRQPLRATS
jgi:LysR family transcriptional regulator, transcription activator of glutamate synthase operon